MRFTKVRIRRRSELGSFFAGQVCLVTGGARGIGWALTQALAAHGARVFVCDSSTDNLAATAEEARSLPWREQIAFT